jgi:hypothetical protein
MSWYPETMGWKVAAVPEWLARDEPVGAEVAPRVVVERRHFLWLAAAAAGGWALSPAPAPGQEDQRKEPAGKPDSPQGPAAPPRPAALTFDDFAREAWPHARELVRTPEPNEETYLFSLASLLARMRPPEGKFARGPAKIGYGLAYYHQPLRVIQLRFEPGASIPLHDHREYNGILVGVEGEARVRNFEIFGRKDRPPKGERFQIRETQRGILTPGRQSILSRTRDNLHEVVAGPDGARLLDVFTFFSPEARSHDLDFRDKPVDAERRLYEATWK